MAPTRSMRLHLTPPATSLCSRSVRHAESSSCLASYDAVTGALRPAFGSGGMQVVPGRAIRRPRGIDQRAGERSFCIAWVAWRGPISYHRHRALDFCIMRLSPKSARPTPISWPALAGWPPRFPPTNLMTLPTRCLLQPDGKPFAADVPDISDCPRPLPYSATTPTVTRDTSFTRHLRPVARSRHVGLAKATHPVSGIRLLHP